MSARDVPRAQNCMQCPHREYMHAHQPQEVRTCTRTQCMHARAHVHTHPRTHGRMHARTHAPSHTRTRGDTHTHACTHTHTHIHMHTHTHTHTHTHVYTHTHTHRHTHTHTHTHTETHTHTHIRTRTKEKWIRGVPLSTQYGCTFSDQKKIITSSQPNEAESVEHQHTPGHVPGHSHRH
jgi:hypothetical protein